MSTRAARNWTKEERRTLIEMRLAGHGLKAVSAELGKSVKAISNYISRNNIAARPRRQNREIPLQERLEVTGSNRLRDAITDCLARFANDNRMTPDEARAILLGSECQRAVTRIRPTATSHTGHSPFEIVSGRFQPKSQGVAA